MSSSTHRLDHLPLSDIKTIDSINFMNCRKLYPNPNRDSDWLDRIPIGIPIGYQNPNQRLQHFYLSSSVPRCGSLLGTYVCMLGTSVPIVGCYISSRLCAGTRDWCSNASLAAYKLKSLFIGMNLGPQRSSALCCNLWIRHQKMRQARFAVDGRDITSGATINGAMIRVSVTAIGGRCWHRE